VKQIPLSEIHFDRRLSEATLDVRPHDAEKTDFYTEGGVVHPIRDSEGYDSDIGDAPKPDKPTDWRTALGSALTVRDADNRYVQLHLSHLALVPPKMLGDYASQGGTIVLGKGPVTDVRPDLVGVQPRGWPAGSTWAQVAGMYSEMNKHVYAGDEAPHGSASAVLHELGHGLGSLLGGYEATATAWASAMGDPYERQPGLVTWNGETYSAGARETFAESVALYGLNGVSAVANSYGAAYSRAFESWWKKASG
jgi:hypothetical protein